MFTGLIEEIGYIQKINKTTKSAKLNIRASKVLEGSKVGDSICTNGVCLTVVHMDAISFTVDVMPETMRSSNLGELTTNSPVNLERALQLKDRLGGHMVSGHIDGVGKIHEMIKEANATWVSIKASPKLLKYIIHKGSIAIDGISLTVAYVDQEMFKVSLIPLTKEETTLLGKKIGDSVNLECDMVGKYIEKLMLYSDVTETKKPMDINFLRENGFM